MFAMLTMFDMLPSSRLRAGVTLAQHVDVLHAAGLICASLTHELRCLTIFGVNRPYELGLLFN